MRQQLILNNEAFLISESAYQRIESIIKEDLQQQEINANFLNHSEEKNYNNPLIPSDLPQSKRLLFSKNS